MIKIWQDKLAYMKKSSDWFEILNFRNFDWKIENQEQEQKYEIVKIKNNEIKNIWLYMIPFSFGGSIAHSIIGLEMDNGNEICVSREAQFEQWEERSFWWSINKWYRAIVLRWSAMDMLWLRDHIRWEKVIWYKLKTQEKNQKKLIQTLVELTNNTNSKYTKYNIISQNCASGIWKYIYNQFELPRWSWKLLFTSFIPSILLKKWYIYDVAYDVAYDNEIKKTKRIKKQKTWNFIKNILSYTV